MFIIVGNGYVILYLSTTWSIILYKVNQRCGLHILFLSLVAEYQMDVLVKPCATFL